VEGAAVAEAARLAFPEEVEAEATHQEQLREASRIAEALLFAAAEPLDESEISRRLPDGVTAGETLTALKEEYAHRGVNLVRVNKRWFFRTATDLCWLLSRETVEPKKLSRAAIETLAIVAYHQPVTRADIEEIRGVAISKGTLDVLLETGWVRLRGRRKAPGRPVTYGTTETFLLHFGLESIGDLPGLEELKSAGMFEGRLPQGFGVPTPKDDAALAEDEEPLEAGETFDEAPLNLEEPQEPETETGGEPEGSQEPA
jgi:segregation and condensation protein B